VTFGAVAGLHRALAPVVVRPRSRVVIVRSPVVMHHSRVVIVRSPVVIRRSPVVVVHSTVRVLVGLDMRLGVR
jgi:hypothetical protein